MNDLFAPRGRSELAVLGWSGLYDFESLALLCSYIVLALTLSAVIGFHPTIRKKRHRFSEIDFPKISIIAGLIGLLVGFLISKYGAAIGFAIFGLGGLIRFRTQLNTPRDTTLMIMITLTGLCVGVGLINIAIVTTIFLFVVVFLINRASIYSVAFQIDQTYEARSLSKCLSSRGYQVISETRKSTPEAVAIMFSANEDLDSNQISKIANDKTVNGVLSVSKFEAL